MTRQDIVRKYLNTVVRAPWRWGEMDCSQFAGGMVAALTGIDYRLKYRYDDEDSMAAVLEEHGGVRGICTKHFGAPSNTWGSCADGDIILVDIGEGDTLGIATPSNDQAHLKDVRYVRQVPLSRCELFWSIPCRV